MSSTKKTPRQIIMASLEAVKTYQSTIATSNDLLKLEQVQKNDSLRVTLEATVRMATENRDQSVGKIFRRVQEHVGSSPDALEKFVKQVFPA